MHVGEEYNLNSMKAIIRIILSLINIDGFVHKSEKIMKKELFNKFNSLSDSPLNFQQIDKIEGEFLQELESEKNEEAKNFFFKKNLKKINDKYLASTILISMISIAKSDNDYHHLEKDYIEYASNLWSEL